MDDSLKEKCGVFGIFSNEEDDISPYIWYGLVSLQHRGQESCGITTHKNKFYSEKSMGLVTEALTKDKIQKLKGNKGIGHVRYSTTGESVIENAQPFIIRHAQNTIAVAHNGNVTNVQDLKKKLDDEGHVFSSTTDTEIIAHLIIKEFLIVKNMVAAITQVMKNLYGSYSIVILTEDELIAVRDPLGVRPLCLGKLHDKYVVASESVALDVINASLLRDIEPGEILVIDKNGLHSHKPFKSIRKAHCVFEYVYFARPDSILNGVQVYKVRERIGRIQGRKNNVKGDFVSPVPDSAIPFALSYASETKIPYKESLIKNRYIGRTFILPSYKARELAIRLKLNPRTYEVRDKKIILFDDSIVRGTTSRRIIRMLKNSGAKEIHMKVGCPPIKSPCRFGIDMPTSRELIASGKSVEDVRKEIGADSLEYLKVDELVDAIGLKREELCLGCLTGDYPFSILVEKQKELSKYSDKLDIKLS